MTTSTDTRTALVTGGTRGIGAAITRRLATGDYRVAAVCPDLEKAAAFRREVEAEDLPVTVLEGDTSAPDDCERLVKQVVEELGHLDVLVNNAGITADRSTRKMTLDEWHRIIQVNLSGTFFMSKFALDHLAGSDSGRIVNISSLIGESGSFGQANYAASKSGIVGLTKVLAIECASRG